MRLSRKLLPFPELLRERVACILCIAMIVGFFCSRALLSLSVVALFMLALHPAHIRHCWQVWKADRFAQLSFLFFFSYLVSGLWSSDTGQWVRAVSNKLPFAVLPFAFALVPLEKPRYLRWITGVLLMCQMIVIAYSLYMFGDNFHYYLRGYHVSHTLPTTRYNDHIRFSLSLVLSLVIICYVLFERQDWWIGRWVKMMLGVAGVVFVVYLHVLAAKTGIICLYAMAAAYLLYKLWSLRLAYRIAGMALLLTMPLMAFWLIPTFRTKFHYVLYEFRKAQDKEKVDYALSDVGRVVSFQVGWELNRKSPLLGVGAGDVKREMDRMYGKLYPQIPERARLVPHNQYQYSWLAVGGLGALSLIGMCLSSFFSRFRPSIYPVLTSSILLLAMLAEAMLEIQFGIFLFLFYILFWRRCAG